MRCPNCDMLLGAEEEEWWYARNFKWPVCPYCGHEFTEGGRNLRKKKPVNRFGRKVV